MKTRTFLQFVTPSVALMLLLLARRALPWPWPLPMMMPLPWWWPLAPMRAALSAEPMADRAPRGGDSDGDDGCRRRGWGWWCRPGVPPTPLPLSPPTPPPPAADAARLAAPALCACPRVKRC